MAAVLLLVAMPTCLDKAGRKESGMPTSTVAGATTAEPYSTSMEIDIAGQTTMIRMVIQSVLRGLREVLSNSGTISCTGFL
jgi:hypothetical protein